MEHPQMRQVLRGLAVGWNIMTGDEFDAWAVMFENDGEMMQEMANKVLGQDYADDDLLPAWMGFATAVRTKTALAEAIENFTDYPPGRPESAELQRRFDAIDMTAFFPDGVAYPGRDLPVFIIE